MLTAMFKRPGGKLQSLKNLSAWGYIVESGTQWVRIITHFVLTSPFMWGIIKQISIWNTESLGKFCWPHVSFGDLVNHNPEKLKNFVTKRKPPNLIALITEIHSHLLLLPPACFMDNDEICRV